MIYIELLPHLIRNSLIAIVPFKLVQPPYPKSYDPNVKCEYHAGAVGHAIEKCWGLKHKVYHLIDMGWLSFKENSPNVGNIPLPWHKNPAIKDVAERVQTPMGFVFNELLKYKIISKESVGVGESSICSNIKESYTKLLQNLMDSGLVRVYKGRKEEAMVTIQRENKGNGAPKPLVIHFTLTTTAPKLLVIQIPSSFPYKDSKAIPWKYNVEI
ncbi:hypothetical protein CR513_50057, partial [Mucuna pruriens]